MKLQHIAAAVALATAGASSFAAIDRGAAGNGSLTLIAFDKAFGTTTAGVFDLGLTLNDIAGATGNGAGYAAGSLGALANTSIVWDFNLNTIKVNGVTTSFGGSNDWTAAWNRLLANSDAADLRFVVTAFDSTGIGTAKRTIVTANATQDPVLLTSQEGNKHTIVQQASTSNDIFTPLAGKGTIDTAANGAYTFTADDGAATRANGYAMAGDGFGNNWRNGVVLTGAEALPNTQETTALWLLDGGTAGNEARSAGYISLNVAAGQLVYAPAIPEPSTYALAIVGLVAAGVAARRRRAA